MPIGKTILGQKTGRPVRVSADGYPRVLPIGITVAWDLVTAASVYTELADGTPVYPGEKAIEFGTILVPITTQEVQTVTINGSPTGGTFTLKLDALGRVEQTGPLAYNASGADVQTAIRALSNANPAIAVSKSSNVYTVTFPAIMGNVTQLTSTNALTGGTTPAVAHATTTPGVAYGGMWAPYDSSQSDGRQTLTRDSVGILDYTIKNSEGTVMGVYLDTTNIGVITGGLVWRERLKVGGANQPTLSALQAVMPYLELTPAE